MEKKLAVIALGGNALLREIKKVLLKSKMPIPSTLWRIWYI